MSFFSIMEAVLGSACPSGAQEQSFSVVLVVKGLNLAEICLDTAR
jgi:hypothetical protein